MSLRTAKACRRGPKGGCVGGVIHVATCWVCGDEYEACEGHGRPAALRSLRGHQAITHTKPQVERARRAAQDPS